MIPISEAIDIIKRETKPLRHEKVKLAEAAGRVLAEDIVADTDLPPFDRSQMDGFAVRAADTSVAPARLKIAGESAAGSGWQKTMKPGEAVRIMTGAPVPRGADAVQKIELTGEDGKFVEIRESVKAGQFITPSGSEIENGATVFQSGEQITTGMLAALASFGYAKVRVARRPHIGILVTGNEIVAVNKTPKRDQIRDSNSTVLRAYAENCGAEVEIFSPAGDDLGKLKKAIAKAAAKTNLLVLSGGVSVGKYDFTKAALAELGAEIFFEKISLKPGKPMVFAKSRDTLIFGLPGNPVSAAVTFHLFVRTAIMLMQAATNPEMLSGCAVTATNIKAAKERDSMLPVRVETDAGGRLSIESLRFNGSSDFIAFARANALVYVPQGQSIEAGKTAKVLFL